MHLHTICGIHTADKESVNSRYISVYRPFMSVLVSIIGTVLSIIAKNSRSRIGNLSRERIEHVKNEAATPCYGNSHLTCVRTLLSLYIIYGILYLKDRSSSCGTMLEKPWGL